MNHLIYTVGHSNHTIDYFLELIQHFEVDCIVDIRSIPASSYNPQFNQKALKSSLSQQGIAYLHMPDAFGAIQKNPALLDAAGRVDFAKAIQGRDFQQGVKRLQKGLEKGFTIALMCAESTPLMCHRFCFVSLGLTAEGLEIWHILKDKTLQSNASLELELLQKFEKKLSQPSIFEPDISPEQQLKTAYKLMNQLFSPVVKV